MLFAININLKFKTEQSISITTEHNDVIYVCRFSAILQLIHSER